jgi:hypothetical protein
MKRGLGRRGGNGDGRGADHDILSEAGAADANPVVAALDFQFRDASFGRQVY